MVGPIAA